MKDVKMSLYHRKTPLVIALIHALYELPGCGCGGIAHVLIDDENVTDDDIAWMMEKVNSDDEWYTGSIERDLVELLCRELSEMTLEQRLAIFEMIRLNINNENLYQEYESAIQDSVNITLEDYY